MIFIKIIECIHGVDKIRFVNAYILEGDELIVIDTGMKGGAKRIINYIKNLGRGPDEVSMVVHTHYHTDHTGGAFELKHVTGAKLAIHEKDNEFLSGDKKGLSIPFMDISPVKADVLLKKGDKIGDFEVLHTPGHTPGSICLYNQDRGIIFTGDAVQCGFLGGITTPYRMFSWDIKKVKESIKKISELEFNVMLPGHGKPVTSEASKKVKEFSNKKLKIYR